MADTLNGSRVSGSGFAEAIGWLADPAEPRLLLLTGSDPDTATPDSAAPNTADSLAAMLAVMAHDLEPAARIHAQASARGLSPRTLSWVLAAQLGLSVGGPVELVDRLAEDRRRITVLIAEYDHPAEETALVDDLLAPMLRLPHVRLILACATPPAGLGISGIVLALAEQQPLPAALPQEQPQSQEPQEPPQPQPRLTATALADPRTLLTAEPLDLSASVEAAWADLAPIRRRQWDWFGQALTTVEPTHPARMSLLHVVAKATADTALAELVQPHLADAPTRVLWSRWEPASASLPDDSGWPGPITALCEGRGSGAGSVLAVDTLGRIHALDPATGRELGRPYHPPLQGRALAALESGLLLSDPVGTLVLSQPTEAAGSTDRTGDLLSPDRSPAAHDRAVLSALQYLVSDAEFGRPVSALAADPRSGVLALGYEDGRVQLFDPRIRQALCPPKAAHQGPVTALCAVTVTSGGTSSAGDGSTEAVLCFASGGLDGRVVLGSSTETVVADADAAAEGGRTLAARGAAVTALAAVPTPSGPVIAAGWADGLITMYAMPSHEAELVNLGTAPTAMHLSPDGVLVAAGPFGLIALRIGVGCGPVRWETGQVAG